MAGEQKNNKLSARINVYIFADGAKKIKKKVLRAFFLQERDLLV